MREFANNSEVRAAYISPSWPPESHSNGIISYVANLGIGLDECGEDHYVIAGDFTGTESRFAIRAISPIDSCSGWKRLLLKAARRAAPHRIRQSLRAESLITAIQRLHGQARVQLVEMEESFGLAARIVKDSPVPVVVRLHGPWFIVGPALGAPQNAEYSRRVHDEGEAIVRAAGVTAPSQHVLDRVREFYGLDLPNALVIPNPIAPVPLERQWSPVTCEPNTLLFVGRFDRVKGADILLDAFAQVHRVRPEARLTAVGPDSGMLDDTGRPVTLQSFLQERLPDEQTRAGVRWRQTLSPDEILSLRKQHAITIISSRFENCPMAVLEAMACGAPLVASEVGGIPELIRYGENGLLFRPEDTDDLARKILLLLSRPELAARLGRNASHTAETRHHPGVIARQMLEFYRDILGKPAKESAAAYQMAAST